RRIWVILDELPTLHQVPSLQPGLAESRQFGGCFVLGVQVASALRDLYGRNGAETISGLCGTRVVLAAPDRDTAQWSADSLGRSEVEEVAEGFSYGANTIRDGVSLTPRRELRALALPSEIMRLRNLSGYLKFPGPFPVASIRLRYVKRPAAAARFVPREGDAGSGRLDRPGPLPESGMPGAAAGSNAGGKNVRKTKNPNERAGPEQAPDVAPVPPPEVSGLLTCFRDEPAAATLDQARSGANVTKADEAPVLGPVDAGTCGESREGGAQAGWF
ncbi:MAG: type IV secretion system DNA-binding domain-containing protein, partial [Chloroflexi bacterium]|nr:type IV secretion system DNA-binding domain-containing protein [Chloroflexota bacterium]